MRGAPARVLVLAVGVAVAVAVTLAVRLRCGGPSPVARTTATAPATGAAGDVRRLPGWCIGNTHAHTNNSGDGFTPPAAVAAWYERAGWDFIVLTDHNFVTVLDWKGRLAVIPGVEITRNVRVSDPGPRADWLPIHVNALFVPAERAGPLLDLPVPTAELPSREAVYLDAIARAERLGGLPALNHPTFHGAVSEDLFVRLATRGLGFFEVGNASSDIHNEGEEGGPSTERLWDVALGAGATTFGLASDDSHHFDDADAFEARGEPAYRPGRGWIVVHADVCTADTLRAAMARGDFYSTWGPTLASIDRGERSADTLRLASAAPLTFRFVGTGGAVLAESRGTTAAYTLRPEDPWVRAVAEDDDGRKAWVQPLRR